MCGRYVSPEELRLFVNKYGIEMVDELLKAGFWVPIETLKQTEIPFTYNETKDGYMGEGLANYNCSPTQKLPVVTNDEGLQLMYWGYQVKIFDPKNRKMKVTEVINSKGEKVNSSKNYKESFLQRRCLVLAKGFIEWRKKPDGSKQPYFIYVKGKDMVSYAGIWRENVDEESGEVKKGFSIITTEPNDFMSNYHNRMPVILPEDKEDVWLNPDTDPETLQSLIVPYPSEMDAYPIAKSVGSPKVNTPENLEPVEI